MPQLKTRPAAVFFDLDGTLVDTADDLAAPVNHMREARGLKPLPLEEYRPFASAGLWGLLHIGLDTTTDDPDYPVLRAEFRVDPDTGRIDWVQPGLEMQQLGTPADPLRLDTKPVETPVAGPKGEELKPEKPADPTTAETPKPGGGGAPVDSDKLDPCKLHPDILACQKYGEIKEPPKMGEQLIPMDIRPYGGASAGSCR